VSHLGQEEGGKGINDIYQKLYEFREVDQDESNLFDYCPKLSQEAKDQMETKL
jgi:hypothetical protein